MFVSVLVNILVDQTLWCCFFICPFCVLSNSGKCCQTVDGVIVGHVLKFPALIALFHVSSTGNPVAAWKCRRPSGPKPEIQHDRRGRGVPTLT